MHEEYIKSGGNNRIAGATVWRHRKTITAAALIMILVFGSFILGGNRVIKSSAIGLAGLAFLVYASSSDGRWPSDHDGFDKAMVPARPIRTP